MISLLTAVAATTAIEIVEMFSAGAILAATVYTASKSGKTPRKR
jgi:hypothetical protein